MLLRYDSTHGRFPGDVQAEDGHLLVDGRKIRVLSESDPADLPWGELGVTVVVESTGRFTDREGAAAHLEGGAQRVVISAPAKGVGRHVRDGCERRRIRPGVHVVVSNASCTTNCFVPMVKVLDDAFGIEAGLMTTVHAMTNDQNLLDLAHRDLRRARAAPLNIVPASTGAARRDGSGAAGDGGPARRACRFAFPVGDGSITDFTALVRGSVGPDDMNAGVPRGLRVGTARAVSRLHRGPDRVVRHSSATRRRASSTRD